MRTLKFIVEDHIIKKDPNCDFSNLVPGTEGYIRAEFSFSNDWTGCKKVAAFYSNLGHEFEPQILEDGKSCFIPKEALQKEKFSIRVIGRAKNLKIITGKIIVIQDGGK